jgi:hypothetical protein
MPDPVDLTLIGRRPPGNTFLYKLAKALEETLNLGRLINNHHEYYLFELPKQIQNTG